MHPGRFCLQGESAYGASARIQGIWADPPKSASGGAEGLTDSPSPNQKSKRYVSYWNTFLFVIQLVVQFLNFASKLRKNIRFFSFNILEPQNL